MHSGLPYYISNIILTFFWMLTANIVLDSRFEKKKTLLIEFLIQAVIWVIGEKYFAVFSATRFIVGIGLPIVIIQFFHTDGWAFKLMTGIMIGVALVLSEALLGSMLPYDVIQSGEIFVTHGVIIYSVFLFFNLTFLLLFAVALRSYKKRYQGLLVEKEWLLFCLFPLSQCFSIWAWFYSYNSFNTLEHFGIIVFLLVIFLAADIALIYMLRLTSARAELKVKNEMLEDQIRSQGNYYDQLAETYAGIRRMRHDIDNHLYTIKALLDNGNTGDAAEYAERIIAEDRISVRFADCRNTVVASYLEKKITDMEAAGIEVETDIHIPADISAANPDLICIYGNILDNVTEACRHLEHPKAELKTIYRSPYLTISCRNPLPASTGTKKQRFPGLERGLGRPILAHIAGKYDGQSVSEEKENEYVTEVILKADILSGKAAEQPDDSVKQG